MHSIYFASLDLDKIRRCPTAARAAVGLSQAAITRAIAADVRQPAVPHHADICLASIARERERLPPA